MKFEQLLQKLHASKQYSEFTKKYKDPFVVAGFFVIDLEGKNNIYQIDYYVPSENKIAAFSLGSPISMQLLEMMKSDAKPVELPKSTNIDLDSLPGILDDEMKNRSITEEIKKMVAILHTSEGRAVWNVSCMLSGMSILKAHVEDSSESVLKMERSSLMDIMKQVPGNKMQSGFPQQPFLPKGKEDTEGKRLTKTAEKAALTEELKKLDAIEEQIDKEKEAIKTQLEKEKAAAKKEDSKAEKKSKKK